MHIVILILFLYNTLKYSNTEVIQCCQGKNIIVDGHCWDGSNITQLPCESQILTGPTQDPPITLEIDDDDDSLNIYDEAGYYKVDPDKYCITKDNETDLALVCVQEDEVLTNPTEAVFFYLKLVCCLISVILLLAIFLVYVFIPELQDIEGICIINFVASICVAYMIFLISPALALMDPFPCDTVSFIFFTGTLSAVNWMNVVSFHLWRITIRPIFQTQMKWKLIYCGYGYGLPILLIVTALITHHSINTDLTTGENQCLMDMGNLLIFVYFYGPILIMIFLSLILQLWVAKKIWLDTTSNDQAMIRLRKKSLMYGHLLLVVGTIYILDSISYMTVAYDDHLDNFWHLSDCRTLLSGGVVFFIFIVLRNKVLKALAKKGLFCLKFPKKWEEMIDEESEHLAVDERRLTRHSTGL